ncbi:2'-5' RNA ligase family protein [Paenibacillus thermoaerophilus]|uniref:Putative phosphoesterase ACFQWB_12150 n=1 Tax=Paenibacillus thermoaerophilus TaxID=1215385 RepID=A0ABW2V6J2_9BACL|nr:2'-5' RNA ligase family protein [Paenibacillus thermoaerophilus]TMV11984.1 phosphoesterase [Paenibacillus thermoaerophilus]
MKFGIAVFPNKDVQDFANSYRKRFDSRYALIQPHLTVRPPESGDEARIEEAARALTAVCAELRPFQAELNRFSSFYPVSNVIYLALKDPEPFVELHRRICSGPLAGPRTDYAYTPHLTIGQDLTDEELHDVLSSLRMKPVSLKFRVDRVHLLYQTENGAWTTYQTFLFGNG